MKQQFADVVATAVVLYLGRHERSWPDHCVNERLPAGLSFGAMSQWLALWGTVRKAVVRKSSNAPFPVTPDIAAGAYNTAAAVALEFVNTHCPDAGNPEGLVPTAREIAQLVAAALAPVYEEARDQLPP